MRNDANYDEETTANPSHPSQSASDSDEAVTQGRDVLDTSREGATQGTDVIEDEADPEVETLGSTVIDHSRESETQGVDVIDEGPRDEGSRSDTADEDADH